MRLSAECIKSLQQILKNEYGLEYSNEEAQEAGLAIMRFALAKLRRSEELQNHKTKDNDNGNISRTTKSAGN